MKPVCMVNGAGAGIGGNVGKRFAREGYHSVLCRRTDQEDPARSVERRVDGVAGGLCIVAVIEIEGRRIAVGQACRPVAELDVVGHAIDDEVPDAIGRVATQ